MIEHVYHRAKRAKSVSRVIVATDDLRIATRVMAFGGEVKLTRADHPSGTDRLAEVASKLNCDVVVNVQGDEPLIDPGAIDEAVAAFTDPSVLITTLYRRITDSAELKNPNIVKIAIDRGGFALYFSRSRVPFPRGPQSSGAGPFKHIGLYVYRREFLLKVAALAPTPLERSESLEQLRVLEHGFSIKMVETSHDSIGVDTPEDLERVRRLLTAGARA